MDGDNTVATSARPATPLNEKAIRLAEPGATLRDDQVKGLHIRCFAERKSFYLYYRTKAGIERKPKIGDFGSITLAHARAISRQILVEVAGGHDPMQKRIDDRAEHTVNDLWEEVFKRHCKRLKSAAELKQQYDNHIRPALGNKRLSEVKYSMLADFMDSKSDTPIMANRLLAQISKMFSFACHPLEWLDKNPAKAVPRYKENKRRRYMTAEEAAAVARELAAQAEKFPASVAFIYLLILTGARKGEIAAARIEWLHGNVLRLPDSKTGFRQIFLPPVAMDVISKLKRTEGTLTGIADPRDLWHTVRNKANCPDLRLHDLRHSFASVAISAGLTLAQIGELLGHRSTQTTARYAHLMEDAAAAAASLTADQIMGRMKVSV